MRTLVISPHPDDAELACSGLIQKSTSATVCYVTNGDGYRRGAVRYLSIRRPQATDYLRYGMTRAGEAREACRILGATPRFLGFPDGALPALWSAGSVPSPSTRAAAVPYPDAMAPSAAYTVANLVGLIAQVITDVQPDLIAYPDGGDRNGDHRTVAKAVQRVLAGYSGAQWTYIVHADWNLYPLWVDHGQEGRLQPGLEDLPAPRVDLVLTAEQLRRKAAAVHMHASQVTMMPEWMNAFVGPNEPFHVAAKGSALAGVGGHS